MNTENLLLNYLLNAYISEYKGTIESLSKMIYWVTGESPNKAHLRAFLVHSKKIGCYNIAHCKAENHGGNSNFTDLFFIQKID